MSSRILNTYSQKLTRRQQNNLMQLNSSSATGNKCAKSVQSVKSRLVNKSQNSCRKSLQSALILYIWVADSIVDDLNWSVWPAIKILRLKNSNLFQTKDYLKNCANIWTLHIQCFACVQKKILIKTNFRFAIYLTNHRGIVANSVLKRSWRCCSFHIVNRCDGVLVDLCKLWLKWFRIN